MVTADHLQHYGSFPGDGNSVRLAETRSQNDRRTVDVVDMNLEGNEIDDDDKQRLTLDTPENFEAEERAILREALFALQGISGDRLKFYRVLVEHDDTVGNQQYDVREMNEPLSASLGMLAWSFQVSSYITSLEQRCPLEYRCKSLLGSGARDGLYQCGAAGCFYLQIKMYIQQQDQDMYPQDIAESKSSIVRAFTHALVEELHDYQSTILKQTPTFESLRGMLVRMGTSIARLRTLALIVSSVSCLGRDAGGSVAVTLSGANLLTSLHRHGVNHGDIYMHVPLVTALLQSASQPWFHMLYLWTVQGQLPEKSNDFFIAANETSGTLDGNRRRPLQRAVSFKDMWRRGYALCRDKVPVGLISSDLVDLVYIVGKGVNYIRHCLNDVHWSLSDLELSSGERATPAQRTSRLAELGYAYDTTPIMDRRRTTPRYDNVLRQTLHESATQIHAHILKSLFNEHSLLLHLYALKQFLLMGQGDFYSALFDGLHAAYPHGYSGGNVVGIYQHSLASIMESALRSTNAASFPSHAIERLTVSLRLAKDHDARYKLAERKAVETSTSFNDQAVTVFDIFTMEYSVPDPLTAIVHDETMETYRAMFLFLFRLNNVEYLLHLTWRQSSVLQRALHANAQHLVIQASTNWSYAQAIVLLRQVAMTRQSMVHFVVNIKSYLMSEVLEGGWKRLVPIIEEAKSLDEVIEAHEQYLLSIHGQSLLFDTTERGGGGLHLAGKMDMLLQLVGEFCSYQQGLLGEALEAADRAAQKRRQAEEQMQHGSWGYAQQREAVEQETCFGLSDAKKLDELDGLSQAFQAHMLAFLTALDNKLNGSPAAWNATGTPNPMDNPDDDVEDLDSLRFLASQLSHNKFYGAMNF